MFFEASLSKSPAYTPAELDTLLGTKLPVSAPMPDWLREDGLSGFTLSTGVTALTNVLIAEIPFKADAQKLMTSTPPSPGRGVGAGFLFVNGGKHSGTRVLKTVEDSVKLVIDANKARGIETKLDGVFVFVDGDVCPHSKKLIPVITDFAKKNPEVPIVVLRVSSDNRDTHNLWKDAPLNVVILQDGQLKVTPNVGVDVASLAYILRRSPEGAWSFQDAKASRPQGLSDREKVWGSQVVFSSPDSWRWALSLAIRVQKPSVTQEELDRRLSMISTSTFKPLNGATSGCTLRVWDGNL
jgi:thiol-disulfide isomerase/thioredoxin